MSEIIWDVDDESRQEELLRLEIALASTPGVERALVDMHNGIIHVEYDSDRTTPDRIERWIERQKITSDKNSDN